MKTKTICLWCGKDHKAKHPKACREYSHLMSAICKKVPVYQVMHMLHVYGTIALHILAAELNIPNERNPK